jgi:hypothetical protein
MAERVMEERAGHWKTICMSVKYKPQGHATAEIVCESQSFYNI